MSYSQCTVQFNKKAEPTCSQTDCTPVSYHDLQVDAVSSSETDLQEQERLFLKTKVSSRLLEVSVYT